MDSTNAAAERAAQAGAPEGTCIVAQTQTAGRGRLGRRWHSPRGGLWLSVVLRPRAACASANPGMLSIVAGVAAAEAIRATTSLPARVKWPNDVIVAGRKVCGVLVEGRWRGSALEWVVVGIGINVCVDLGGLPPEVRANAGTLLAPSDPAAPFVLESLLACLLSRLEAAYHDFLSGGFSGILERARQHCSTLGQRVVVTGRGAPIEGLALDIGPDGALVVRTAFGDVRVSSGEVSIRVQTPGGGPAG